MSLRSSIAFSLVLHALIALAWVTLFRQDAARQDAKRVVWIEVEPRPRVKPADRDEESNSRRLVQTDSGQQTDKAAPDAYLGERTQVVDRQTVSRKKETTLGKAAASKPSAAPKPQAAPAPHDPAIARHGTSGPLARFGMALPRAQSAPQALREVAREEWGSDQSGVPQDYIKGVNESERTALNTKEYVFYGYYQRIRERLDLAWTRSLRHQLNKLYRGGRQLASDMEHTTRLIVTLNTAGEIVRVQILEESGTRDLDQAAIEAFNQAGPFPNPPRGIADNSGKIEIRWNFVLRS